MACVTANIEICKSGLNADMQLQRDEVNASLSPTCSIGTDDILFASDGLLIDNNGEAIYTNE